MPRVCQNILLNSIHQIYAVEAPQHPKQLTSQHFKQVALQTPSKLTSQHYKQLAQLFQFVQGTD